MTPSSASVWILSFYVGCADDMNCMPKWLEILFLFSNQLERRTSKLHGRTDELSRETLCLDCTAAIEKWHGGPSKAEMEARLQIMEVVQVNDSDTQLVSFLWQRYTSLYRLVNHLHLTNGSLVEQSFDGCTLEEKSYSSDQIALWKSGWQSTRSLMVCGLATGYQVDGNLRNPCFGTFWDDQNSGTTPTSLILAWHGRRGTQDTENL